jgi:hypothetical protein
LEKEIDNQTRSNWLSVINCTWIDLSVRLISIHSLIHLCLFFYLVCQLISFDWLIWLEREERWKERMEEEEMTLDWHWLIENRVCSRNESWLVWLISFHWLIDWWIESANYQLWIKQTNKQQITRNKQTKQIKETNNLAFIHSFDWLIGWFVNWFWFVSELRECDLIDC